MPRPIGIVVAFPQEIQSFLKLLPDKSKSRDGSITYHEAHLGKYDLVIAVGGMGRENAIKTTKALMKKYQPQGVISAGFSGATLPDLKTGVVILPEQILNLNENGKSIITYQIEPQWWQNQVWEVMNFSGNLLCVDEVITIAEQKRKLGLEFHAIMVDMESGGVAMVADEYRIPFCAIRVILDRAGESLPLDFNQYTDSNNNLLYGKIIWSLLKKPSLIGKMLDLSKKSHAASKQLAGFLLLIFSLQTAIGRQAKSA